MAHFERLELNNWRQFEAIDIRFGTQTTVVTGANGCGKTSILTVLGHHFGWNLQFVSTPYVSRRTRRLLYSEFRKRDALKMERESIASIPEDVDESATPDQGPQSVGAITYSDGRSCDLRTPSKIATNPQYHLQYSAAQSIEGLYIPSHRPAASYHQVSTIPTNPKTTAQQYQEYQQLLLQSFSSARSNNPGAITKQSLIALAVFGYGNDAVTENTEYRELFEEFQDILRKILPQKLGFDRLEIRMPDVVLVTRTGEFALDAMSGGVNALFTIAWQILMFGRGKAECTVLIDEPENHLHPSMQRALMPSLAAAFPKYRFIVATHSPFIVTSDPTAGVYALTHGESGRIASSLLPSSSLAASPDKVLREVLEVPSVIPIWAENALAMALSDFAERGSDRQAMDDLFAKLREIGLTASVADLPPFEGK